MSAFESAESKDLSDMDFAELNTVGWNAFLEGDEGTLEAVSAVVTGRTLFGRMVLDGVGLHQVSPDTVRYNSLSKSLHRDLEKLRKLREKR